MWGQSCPLVVLSRLWYFIISVPVHVCVYDVGCFVDALASRSRYCGRKLSVPIIAILLRLLSGYVDRVTDWYVTGPGFAPRRVPMWIKNSFKALVYTLCEDNLVPWLRYSFSDISLSVCLFMCVYMMLVALLICLWVGVGIGGRKRSVPMIAILLSSLVGVSMEWLTGVSQVLGLVPDVFNCELNITTSHGTPNSHVRERDIPRKWII